ncbi:MAG: hypothetical protein J3Q66DRAFT_397726 [Benniella sp.]|nr:MAG: hypothetical protein J3Q66DRAFT_397726 [Benniella sp.]
MPSTHPLELTELLSLVFAYLPPRSLPICARVSKSWYQVCIPLIWHDIDLQAILQSPQSPALIQNHSCLIKKFKVGYMSPEYAALRFSNLDSFEMDGQGRRDPHTNQFILAHPTVTRLRLTNFYGCPPAFWDALLGFHNLRTLSMSSLEIFGTNINQFWQLCARLEQLDILVQHYTAFDVILPPGNLACIKHLGVMECTYANVPLFMEFIRRCPGLTSIRWNAAKYHEQPFLSKLPALLEAKALPYLEHLDVGARGATNDDVAKVIQSMPRITTLSLALSYHAYQMDFATLLQPHFSNLRVLEVLPDSDIKSRLAQDIMSSCPLLEKLVAPSVDALVVTEGKPWVCSRLKVLDLAFCFDPPSTVSYLQPLVFAQLSKLTRLETWCITGPSGFSVDLRIESGLDKLFTLGRLRSVVLNDIVERMDVAEVDWMLEHWKSLMVFRGKLNTYDDAIRGALKERLGRHGIKEW